MCTVSLFRGEARLLVTMNRDESLSRGPESPPRLHAGVGPVWLGPTDGESGGTWIGANEFGVVACLLNRYSAGEGDADATRSRGEIIPALLRRGPLDRCLERLFGEFQPHPHRPFDLILIATEGGAVASWDGCGALLRSDLPAGWWALTSSSWNREAVVQWRMRRFRDWADQAEPVFDRQIPAFHLLHEAGKEWWSPLVKRDRVETRSITQVEVRADQDRLEIRYWPRPLLDLERVRRLTIPITDPLTAAG